MINSPPCQVKAMSSHLINTPSGLLRAASSISSQVPTLTSPCVTPVLSLSMSVPVINPITYGSAPVMSHLCPLSPDAASAPLKTMQAMSHKQPVDLPIGSAFIEEVNDKDLSMPPSSPQLISHATVQHINNPDFTNSSGLARSVKNGFSNLT